jgi:hypothetical protein
MPAQILQLDTDEKKNDMLIVTVSYVADRLTHGTPAPVWSRDGGY